MEMNNSINDCCIFPLCDRKIERDEFCFLHAKHFAGEKKKIAPTPIAKESTKRKKLNKEYRKIVKEELSKDDRCKIKSPVCTGKAQGMNHKQKRSPKNLTNRKNLERSCNPCNQYCETNPGWAKANGHQISRFKK